jgi:CheY-like chemotaxis protein
MILIVEDELISRKALSSLLTASGYSNEAFSTAEQAVDALERGHVPDWALIDLDLPGMNGVDLVKYIEKHNPSVHSVIITAACREKVAALRHGTDTLFMRKPIDFRQLLSLIHKNQLVH